MDPAADPDDHQGRISPSSIARMKLSSSVRLVLVDADNESRLLGCVICRSSFLTQYGDCPATLAAVLQLRQRDAQPEEPFPLTALDIISVTPNEVTVALKSQAKTESCFESEAKVVFIEGSGEEDVAIEGLVLLEDRSSSSSQGKAQFKYVYARADSTGMYWYRSRSEFLSASSALEENCLGSLRFSDLVAIRQSRRQFVFDAPTADMLGGFSSLEFVLREGASVTLAMGFPFPLVQWLFVAHSALNLPRMFLTVSQSGNWMTVLTGQKAFSLSSPLVVECLRWSCSQQRLGFSITSGCGGSVVDRVQSVSESEHPAHGSTEVKKMKHEGELVASLQQPSSSSVLQKGILRSFFKPRQDSDEATSPASSPNSAALRKQRNKQQKKKLSFASSGVTNGGTKRSGSYSPSVSSPSSNLLAAITRNKSASVGAQPSSSSTAESSGPESPPKGLVAAPAIIAMPAQVLRTGSSGESGRPIASPSMVEIPSEEVRSHPARMLVDLLDSSKQSEDLKPGDLIICVDSSWVIDSSWRSTRDQILDQLNLRQAEGKPLELIFGRVAPLSALGATEGHKVLDKVSSVQQLLWSFTDARRVVNDVGPMTVRNGGVGGGLIAYQNRDMRRRAAATRQLLRRQTSRVTVGGAPSSNVNDHLQSTLGLEKEPLSSGSSCSAGMTAGANGRESLSNHSQAGGSNQQHSHEARSSVQISGHPPPSALPKALNVVKTTSASSSQHGKSQSLLKRFHVSLRKSTTPRPISMSSSSASLSQHLQQQQRHATSMALSPLIARATDASLGLQERETAAQLLLKLTSDKLNQGVTGPVCIAPLVGVLLDPSTTDGLMEMCAGCLWNLSDVKENALLIAQKGGVQALTRILQLQSASEAAKEEACGALWTLVSDEANASLVVLSGALDPLLRMLDVERSSSFLQENASGCLWNLSALPSARTLLMSSAFPIMPLLFMLLKEGSTISKENAFGIMGNLFIDSKEAKQAVLQRKGVQRIVQAVMFGQTMALKENAAVALLEMSRNDPQMQLEFAREGALTALLKLILTANELDIKTKAAEAICVLAGELSEIKQQLAELGSVPEVLRMLQEAKRSHEERISSARGVQATASNNGPLIVPAEIVADLNFRVEDLGAGKRYVHFDSVVLSSGLEAVLMKAGTESDMRASQLSVAMEEVPIIVDSTNSEVLEKPAVDEDFVVASRSAKHAAMRM